MIWLVAFCATGMMMGQRSETFVAPDAALKEGIRLGKGRVYIPRASCQIQALRNNPRKGAFSKGAFRRA